MASLLAFSCGKSERSPQDEPNGAGAPMGAVASQSAGTAGAAAAATAGSTHHGGGGSPSGNGEDAAVGGSLIGRGGAPAAAGEAAIAGEAATAGEAGALGAGGVSSCEGLYHACGCGCCPGQTATTTCLYPALGQDIFTIIAADQAKAQDTVACANAACMTRQDYICCEAPPPSDDGASYETSVFIGGYDRIRLFKHGAVDCSTFTLVDGPPGGTEFPVETPGNWAIEQITRLPCSSSAIGPKAFGAIGKFSLRVSGDACVVDAHLAAFFGDAMQGVEAERFDADGVPVDIPVAQCH